MLTSQNYAIDSILLRALGNKSDYNASEIIMSFPSMEFSF